MTARFFFINGEISDLETNPGIAEIFMNETFRLEEKIWFCNGKIPLLDEHLLLLRKQTETSNLIYPEILKNRDEVKRIILRMINRNKAFHSGLIVIAIIFQDKKANVIIIIQPSEFDFFELKKDGLLVSFSKNIKYSGNEFNSYRFYNKAFWNSINIKTKTSKLDGLVILNEKDEILEYPEGNIFFIKDMVLFTPSADTGCYVGPIRGKILEAASFVGFKIVETTKLNIQNITGMEEAFVGGESIAMQKITGFGTKRFTHSKTLLINEQLNRILLQD
jgi:branched-subunit amino acid aminotransferase/4-amino-4-deoxychorismate lyase